MSDMDIWLTIALLTLSTILTRSSFFVLGHAVKIPPKVQHALRYAPMAALAAIVIPDLVLVTGPDGAPLLLTLGGMLHNPKLIAGLGATIFFLLSRHLLGTIVVGMALFSVLRQVL